MKQMVFNITIFIMILGLYLDKGIAFTHNKDGTLVQPIFKTDTLYVHKYPEFFKLSPEEGLREALDYYNVKYPNIVYAQAILETGHFQSRLCIVNNNLFGLYDNYNNKFYEFNHWTESVEAYISKVEYKFKGGDYYEFLRALPYAEDENYIYKVKQIESNLPP